MGKFGNPTALGAVDRRFESCHLDKMGVRYSWRGMADCKSVAYGFGGSNPSTPTMEW